MSVLRNKIIAVTAIQHLIAGLTKHLAGQTLGLGGRQVTTEDIVAQLPGYVAGLDRVEAARIAWTLEVRALERQRPAVETSIVAIRNYVKAVFGATSVTALDIGLPARQPAQRSAASKVAAIAKGQATRVARHTMGRRQREAIHGAVPAAATARP